MSLAFVREIHRWPVNSPQKWPLTRKMFPFHYVIMDSGTADFHPATSVCRRPYIEASDCNVFTRQKWGNLLILCIAHNRTFNSIKSSLMGYKVCDFAGNNTERCMSPIALITFVHNQYACVSLCTCALHTLQQWGHSEVFKRPLSAFNTTMAANNSNRRYVTIFKTNNFVVFTSNKQETGAVCFVDFNCFYSDIGILSTWKMSFR